MLYFSSNPLSPDNIYRDQYEKLQDFKDDCSQKGLVVNYNSIDEFKEKFRNQLTLKINDNKYFHQEIETDLIDVDFIYPDNDSSIELSDKAKELLLEAAASRDGTLIKTYSNEGLSIQTNNKYFHSGRDPRVEASLEEAMEQLCEYELLNDKGYQDEVFGITAKGYKFADNLKEQSTS